MLNINNILGYKCYNYVNETVLQLFRVVKIQNEDTIVLEDIHGDIGKRFKINIEDLKKEYKFLKPEATISFSIVQLQGKIKDVIVALHKREDIENKNNIPYCVCRQNVTDVHANTIMKGPINYVGASVSIETVPEGVPYEMLVACESVESFKVVAAYLDDTLDKILSFINCDEFDKVLLSLYNMSKTNMFVKGYVKTLRKLLDENNFMYDFYRAFNILPIKNTYTGTDKIVSVLSQEMFTQNSNDLITMSDKTKLILEHILKCRIENYIILKYDVDIDLSEIKRKYILVSDNKDQVYVISYNQGDAYMNPEVVQQTSDIKEYAKNIKLNLSKYK